MGCGKTTVGQRLAGLTERQFVDMDDWIADKSGMSISEIFSRFGEDDFRRREREACRTLAKNSGLVIAAGGGALTFSENADVLSKTGDIILLDVPLEIILRRLEGDATRPLLAGADRENTARELYDHRLPLYRKAAGFIVNGDGSADDVAQDIMNKLVSL